MSGSAAQSRRVGDYASRIFVLVTLVLFALKIGQRLLPPFLPQIIADLAISPFAAGVALSLMSVMRALLQYPSGRLSDQLSRKTILLSSMLLAALGFSILAVTPNFVTFLVGIAVLGAGIGLYDPADRALVSDLYHEKRGRAFGLHLMAPELAGIAAAGLAIALAATTWRVAFLPSLVVLVPTWGLYYLWSRESVEFRWVSLNVVETGRRLVGPPRIRWPLLVYAIAVFVGSGISSFLPAFLIAVHGFPFALAGATFAVLFAVGIVARPVSGWLSDYLPRLAVVGGGVLLATLSLVVLVVAPSFEVAILAVVGYAVGDRAFGPVLTAHLMDQFPDETMGGDIGGSRAIYTILGSMGPATVGYLVGRFDYALAYVAVAGLLLVAAALSFRLARTE